MTNKKTCYTNKSSQKKLLFRTVLNKLRIFKCPIFQKLRVLRLGVQILLFNSASAREIRASIRPPILEIYTCMYILSQKDFQFPGPVF
jgi:hypothetical protein